MNDTTFQGNGKIAYVAVVVNTKLTKPTNYDILRAKSVEELAEWAAELSCHPAANRETCIDHDRDCEDCWLDWLKQEATMEVTANDS